jgi:hypothetical protein
MAVAIPAEMIAIISAMHRPKWAHAPGRLDNKDPVAGHVVPTGHSFTTSMPAARSIDADVRHRRMSNPIGIICVTTVVVAACATWENNLDRQAGLRPGSSRTS